MQSKEGLGDSQQGGMETEQPAGLDGKEMEMGLDPMLYSLASLPIVGAPSAFPLYYPPSAFFYPSISVDQECSAPNAASQSFFPPTFEYIGGDKDTAQVSSSKDAPLATVSSDSNSATRPISGRISKGRLRWTAEMDALLEEAVGLYDKLGVGMWKKVADHVNAGVNNTFTDENGSPVDFVITNHQCGERYKHHIDPSLRARTRGPWTEEETNQLLELVGQYQSKEEGLTDHGRSKAQVNWLEVSARLNRHYRDCQHKWINMSKATLRNGPFSHEEETLIRKRVEEWGENSNGVWTKLEKELGRRSRSIQDKYKRMAKKKKS